jgi:DNA-binding transcriptional MerR regulator
MHARSAVMRGAAARPVEDWPYKMADLCRLTGMPRQAVHFYIHEGLVPPGRKTGRNTARYGDVHVERIRIVRQLQNERFMPLKAIRAVLDGRDDAFTPEQRGFLVDVKRRLSSTLARPRDARRRIDVRTLLAKSGLDAGDLDDLTHSGVIEIERGPRGTFLYERAVSSLVQREWRATTDRLSTLPPERVATMLEAAMPLVHEFFARYHAKKVRDFFATMTG